MSSDEKAGSQRAVRRPRLSPGPLADLKALIYELYVRAGPPTLDAIAGAIARDHDLVGAPSRDTVKRLIGDPGKPGSQAEVIAVVTVLARLALWDVDHAVGKARDLWVAAVMDSGRTPQGGVLVSEADPRRLGVHAAISVPGVADDVPPEYVLRDADESESGIRARVAAASGRGGFVLLVGGSSVGKTRCAYEVVTTLLPDWWLVHPDGPGEVAALAAIPPHRTVVWLDELQRYLDGEHGLTGGMVRALLNAPDPVVIIGTLWPDWYSAWTAVPRSGQDDLHVRERQVLNLADVIRIAPELSPAEQARARAAATRDRRLKAALDTAGYGLTQTLAAAPQLVARWEDARATAPYAWAVLTAALDAARLGARAPLSADFLRAAAPGYCTSAQQAEAPENWFEQAMAYNTQTLHGAAAALSPTGTGMGQLDGYTVAAYLIQHARDARRSRIPPASFWTAVGSHAHPRDMAALAHAAEYRGLLRDAARSYKQATTHDAAAAARLVQLVRMVNPSDGAAARWAAAHAALDNANDVAWLLRVLREAGAQGQVTTLLERDPAGRIAITDPSHVAWLLKMLREAGAQEQVAALIARDPAAHACLDNARGAIELLSALAAEQAQDQVAALASRAVAAHAATDDLSVIGDFLGALRDAGAQEQFTTLASHVAGQPLAGTHTVGLPGTLVKAGAQEQVAALIARDPAAHVSLRDPRALHDIEDLLLALRDAGAQEQFTALADRAAAEIDLESAWAVGTLLDALRRVEASAQANALIARDPAAYASLDNPFGVASLLKQLRWARADEQVTALIARDPAAHAAADDAYGASLLLEQLRIAGAWEQFTVLAERAATHADLHYTAGIKELLYQLWVPEAQEQLSALLARDPAAHVDLDEQDNVTALLRQLQAMGAQEQASTLADRAASHLKWFNEFSFQRFLDELLKAGKQEQVTALIQRLPGEGEFWLFSEQGDHHQRYRFGRMPDGTPAPAWDWQDLD